MLLLQIQLPLDAPARLVGHLAIAQQLIEKAPLG
jgi:hypothetical protein